MGTHTIRFSAIGSILLVAVTWAQAQAYKCKDPDGTVTYIDRPCSGNTESGKLKIYTYPDSNELRTSNGGKLTPNAQVAEDQIKKERERRAKATQQPNEHEQRILEARKKVEEATRKVEQIRADNYDPQRCAAAKNGIAAMDRKYPQTAHLEIGYSLLKEERNLYCGN